MTLQSRQYHEDAMRLILILLVSLALTGCTAMMVGGGATAGYPAAKDERTAGDVGADAAITSKVRAKHAADPVVSVFDVSVRTYDGTVTLSGSVGSIRARDRAIWLARETDGVIAVNNQILIEDRSE
jgi:hyperosmotically inducible protein